MLERKDNGLGGGTGRGALGLSVFSLAGPGPSPARYPGYLKQLLNYFFSAVTVPENSFYS